MFMVLSDAGFAGKSKFGRQIACYVNWLRLYFQTPQPIDPMIVLVLITPPLCIATRQPRLQQSVN
jgi:hypothetical protein